MTNAKQTKLNGSKGRKLARLLEEFREAKNEKAKAELEYKKIDGEIKELLGDEDFELENDEVRLLWSHTTTSRFDSVAFKKDHPELAEDYLKESDTARLTVTFRD